VLLFAHATTLPLVDDVRKKGVPVFTKPIGLKQLRELLEAK
jgi:hypothetical protein